MKKHGYDAENIGSALSNAGSPLIGSANSPFGPGVGVEEF